MALHLSTDDKTRRGRRSLRVTALALSSAAVIGLMVGLNSDPQTAVAAANVPVAAAPWAGYADLVQKVMPSVVQITVTHQGSNRLVAEQQPPQGPGMKEYRFYGQGPNGEMMRRFMQRFFGQQMPPFGTPTPPHTGPEMALGSGFVIDNTGRIVTNYHVVDGASEVTVTFHDGKEVKGKVIGTDQPTDLALIKVNVNPSELHPVTFADSNKVRVGDPVIAIGSPFGLGDTVTAGIVSAEHRVIGVGRYDDFLQIDAAINRGNSGGPTFDLKGQVIGVNSLIHSPSGGNVGIGFAIPSNEVKQIVDELETYGHVKRGWLGVHIQGIDQDLAQGLGLKSTKGAVVADVNQGGPAARAGFQRGDVILEYNGKPVDQLTDLTRLVANTKAGDTVKVVVWRNNAKKTLDVTIGQMPNQEQAVASNESSGGQANTPKLGVQLAQLTPQTRQQLNLPDNTKGVVVTDVQPGSPAADKGLQPGDVIVEADHKPVTSPSMVAQAVRDAADRGASTILLLVDRNGQDRFVAVPLARA
jgi:serine protease Do